MDLERLSHRGYKISVIVAIVLSGLFVTVAALIGRGTLNLKGSLVLPEPSDVTVIALVEPKLMENVSISSIEFLRKEKVSQEDTEKPNYSYLVKTSDDAHHLVRLTWAKDTETWSLLTYETLHEGKITDVENDVAQDMETRE